MSSLTFRMKRGPVYDFCCEGLRCHRHSSEDALLLALGDQWRACSWKMADEGPLAPQGLAAAGGKHLISSPALQGHSGLILAASMPLDGPHIFPP